MLGGATFRQIHGLEEEATGSRGETVVSIHVKSNRLLHGVFPLAFAGQIASAHSAKQFLCHLLFAFAGQQVQLCPTPSQFYHFPTLFI